MLNMLGRFQPRSLRWQLMLVMVPAVSILILVSGYTLTLSGKAALLQEKENHLFGVTHLMAAHLAAAGGFAALEVEAGGDGEALLWRLNQRLSPYTDTVANAFPGLGVGFYHRRLDAIVTYGPTLEHGDKVGVAIGPQHPGRKVLSSGVAAIESGLQVRGNILNAMTPIIEQGEVVGYIWANELLTRVDAEVAGMRDSILRFASIALLVSLVCIALIIQRLGRDVGVIKTGLAQMEDDLTRRIPALPGETGQIVEAVNRLGASLLEARERERAAASEALNRSEDTLRTAIGAIDEAFALYDPDDRLVFCNERYREIHGPAAERVVPGALFQDIERHAALCGLYPDAMPPLDTWVGDWVHRRRSGAPVMELRTSAGRWLRVIDRATTSGHVVSVAVDVTDLKHATEAAQAANRTKSDFLANMSHEIRTPMNGVIGMTDLLLGTGLDEEQREYAETVKNSANALLELIDDILDFSKIEAGKLDIEIIDFDLRVLLGDITDLLSVRAAQKGLELACVIAPEVPSLLRGDPGRVRQVLLNLMGNAVKFTAKGEVVVSVSLVAQTDDAVRMRMEVRDTGIGIAADDLPTLFSPFTQADASTTRRFGGTGLGLSIARRLIELMDGNVGVDSVVGVGSTFWFELPFALQTGSAGIQRASAIDLAGKRMLVVDDSETTLKVLGTLLRGWGCEVLTASAGNEALALLQAESALGHAIDAAIIDLQMPGLDGEALGRWIKADPHWAAMPLVLLTSAVLRGDVARFAEAGFGAYLSKPIKEKLLRGCLQSVFASELPATQGSERKIVTWHSQREAQAHADILLVEDNLTNQRLAMALLGKLGHRVELAEDGEQALARLAARRYDMVLMDCRMPVMDGLAATRAIRAGEAGVLDPAVPIIAMTANAMDSDRDEALAAGMNDYLTKPINPQLLSACVQRWLDRLCAGVDGEDSTCAY